MLRRLMILSVLGLAFAGRAFGAEGQAFTDPAEAGPDFAVQGEYQGELKAPDQPEPMKVGAQVIAQGEGKFHGVFYFGGLPGDGWERGMPQIESDATTTDGKIVFEGEGGSAVYAEGKLKILDPGGMEIAVLEKVERKSPTLGAKPPADAKVLFDGTNTDAWKVGRLKDELLQAGAMTKDDFGDFTLHLEFRTPFMPAASGQGRGNSGLYLQNRYECQILDSFGLEGKDNECGGFYQIKSPSVNMCFPPLAWQTYDVDFTAAKFEGDKKVSNAKVTVTHNGVKIHDNFELPNLTPGGAPTEAPGKGPFLLQFHGNPVTFRNIWVEEKKS
jgi:hypothetical protein